MKQRKPVEPDVLFETLEELFSDKRVDINSLTTYNRNVI